MKENFQNLIKELKEFATYLTVEEAKAPLNLIEEEEEIEQLRLKVWFLIKALEEIKGDEKNEY